MKPVSLSSACRSWSWLCLGFTLAVGTMFGSAVNHASAEDVQTLFDGKTLKGWDGDPKFWSVRDGAITGQTTADNPTKGNTFLIWEGGDVADFELTLDYRIVAGNSGIQYRSFKLENAADEWRIGGYQADIDSKDTYSGILYGEKYRGILGRRGESNQLTRENGKFAVKTTKKFGDSAEINKKIKKEDWNTYRIVAHGYHFTHFINGVKTTEVVDDDDDQRRAKGLLALQLHQGPPMVVQFKNIKMRKIAKNPATSSTNAKATKKIVFVAGNPSHGYGAHEHKAGCMLLAKHLEASGLPVETAIVTKGWPQDESVFDGADCVVVYADGGGRHPFNAHVAKVNALAEKGVGIVAIHYAVEAPKGEYGDALLNWTGGYFETDWSVNPHWTAKYSKLPEHPVTRGIQPFEINDEWYYHMRFREGMEGVQPILTDLPPASTLSRKDGAHSGNPHVRKAVAAGEPQHMAWALERKDGGRGFGFTGGHFHWNWGHNEFRQLVLNAIVWAAKADVPDDGVPTQPVSVDALQSNQDYEAPGNFNPQRIAEMLKEWNSDS